MPSSFVVVANRLPVEEVDTGDGATRWQRSPGGLVTALYPVLRAQQGTWVGWSGRSGPAAEPFELDGIRLHPVPLDSDEFERYYDGFSNSTLWPLYHDAVETPVFRRRFFDAYRRVNERFAAAAAAEAAHEAVVWVNDYQLQLVPAMLRELRPDVRIGFFLHVPFPPIELFMQMPQRADIMRGLLGSDLIGFQRPLGAHNFMRLTRHLLGLRPRGLTVEVNGRLVTAAAFPISIDTAEMEALAAGPAVQERARDLRAELGNPTTVMLGVDRLDYTKGIVRRLKAYRELLAEGRVTVPETVLVQVATPSRDRLEHYLTVRDRVEREVSRINGDFGKVGTPAVHYLHQSFNRPELAALYLAADVMMVTPLRDGMNLIAKEYVAARVDNGGALVLSEFAGAAGDLPQAYLVNPHDLDGVKDAMVLAAEASATERGRRMRAMRRQVRTHDVAHWAARFLDTLGAKAAATAALSERPIDESASAVHVDRDRTERDLLPAPIRPKPAVSDQPAATTLRPAPTVEPARNRSSARPAPSSGTTRTDQPRTGSGTRRKRA